MPQHDIKFYDLLIVDLTQGILNTTEYFKKDLRFNIFKKGTFK